MRAKRQQTEWLFLARYAKRPLVRVGYIHNKRGRTEDVIRLQIISAAREPLDVAMRVDEAAATSSGLTKLLTYMALGLKKAPGKTLAIMRGAK